VALWRWNSRALTARAASSRNFADVNLGDYQMKKSPIHAIDSSTETELPINVGNPRKAADLAIDQSHMDDFAMAEEGPSEVTCAKPPKGTYFTVKPEAGKPWQDRRFYFMLEVPGRDPFLVAPAIAQRKKEEGEDTIRPVLIARYVTMAGDEGLWALKLDPPDGKSNQWNRSAMTVLKVADESKWVRLLTGKGQYNHNVSPRTFEQTPPRFTSRSFDELINSAFPDDQIVLDGDHEIWNVLSSGSDK
jgi:hypothetical protein